MAEIPVTVDPAGLRAVAARVERIADAVEGVRHTGLSGDELTGSATAATAAPDAVAARLDDVLAGLSGWAESARKAVGAFTVADQDNATRLGRP